jgi:kynurenine formamidase
MNLIDLSQIIEPGIPLFSATAPQPKIYPWQSHAQAANSGRYLGCTCEITEVRLLTSVGTYLDSPYHFYPEKNAIDALKLQQLVLPGLRIDCTGMQKRQPIPASVLNGLPVAGKAVLFYTGWSRYWGKAEYYDHPFLTRQTAEALRDAGAKLVGVDCLVVDNHQDPGRPVHVTLLKQDILIVENLANLQALPTQGFTFHAVPVKVAGAASFPVRAYAALEEERQS